MNKQYQVECACGNKVSMMYDTNFLWETTVDSACNKCKTTIVFSASQSFYKEGEYYIAFVKETGDYILAYEKEYREDSITGSELEVQIITSDKTREIKFLRCLNVDAYKYLFSADKAIIKEVLSGL